MKLSFSEIHLTRHAIARGAQRFGFDVEEVRIIADLICIGDFSVVKEGITGSLVLVRYGHHRIQAAVTRDGFLKTLYPLPSSEEGYRIHRYTTFVNGKLPVMKTGRLHRWLRQRLNEETEWALAA
ncbi:hypothetical protein EBT16_12485 [bacterium]|nr:hypothetical protein [bacterium]